MLVVQSILLGIGANALAYMKFMIIRYFGPDETSDLKEDKIIELISQQSCACTLDENGLKFWPPLFMQRYMSIQEIIEHPIWNGSIKKVVDFGCSEYGLFKCIKPIPGLNKIILVDVDFDTLDINQYRVLPNNYDHITMHQRKEPLVVEIYNGSIADQDDRILGVDAVICIELIEHLYLDVLDSLPKTVFDFIKPKLAVFTTPNVEFNILFPNFTTEFRHDDHKFEWTRKQFKEWAEKIIIRYPEYAVQFDGIGAGPSGTENLGCCTQMAIFYKKDMTKSPVQAINSTPYKLLRCVDYPYELCDENHLEWSIYDKLRQFISEASINNKYIVGDRMEVPLNEIMPYLSDYCSSMDKLKDMVNKIYFTTKNDHGEWLLIHPTPELSSDDYESDSDSDSCSNHSGQEYCLLENTSNIDNDVDDWNISEAISSDKSKLCFSTPMTKDQEFNYYLSNADSFSTVNSNTDLYKTANDYNKSNNNTDIDISSSCNGSIIVDDCKIYQDFKTGRNNSVINEEDINDTDNTLTSVANSNSVCNDSDQLNDNIINDKTIIQNNSNISVNLNCTSDNAQLKSNNRGEIMYSNSDLYKTAIDFNKSEDSMDMDISSSRNGSIIVNDCKIYQDFRTGRNNSIINEEDINETEDTLTRVANNHAFSNESDKLNDNKINDNTIVQNKSNASLKLNCTADTVHKLKSNNPDEIIYSNSDLYKTAIDFNKSDDSMDMDISSSGNGSIIVHDCNVYQDFRTGRNNSVINEEDINETEDTLTGAANNHAFSSVSDKLNDNKINDNTIVQNKSNASLKLNCIADTVHKLKSNNPDENCTTIDQQTECFNRTLLDENDYTENLLSTPDKKTIN